MSDTPGSLRRHAAIAACLIALVLGRAARASAQQGAQQPGPQPLAGPGTAAPDFLTRYDFQLSGAALGIDDQRFSWDTHFGGAVDLVDYGAGRISIVGDYEAVLGDEFRAFDPNQAYYILEASASGWAGKAVEVAGVFHHVSRHISDRPKRYAIAWNVLGARLMRRVDIEDTSISVRLDFGRAIQHADVDYQWMGGGDLVVRQRIGPRAGVFGRAAGEFVTVDETMKHRGTQTGARLEGGVRLEGRAAALELFAGFERRLDADPVDYQPQQWVFGGFRILSK